MTDENRDAALRVSGLVKHFPIRGGFLRRAVGAVHAIDGIDLTLYQGETLGLVGESGCGKSTTGRCIMRLTKPTEGRVEFGGKDVMTMSTAELRAFRKQVQIVFQDPYASLSPRMTVHEIVAEPLKVQGMYRDGGRNRVAELLDLVGLSPSHASRYAHEFSGGQRQRIGIARALALGPSVLILDEPVSALDVSVRAQVVNELRRLQSELGLAYLFISHDLSVVRHTCDRVAVMYLGKIVESGTKHEIFEHASHPYTQALLSAIPVPDPAAQSRRERIVLTGDVPNPAAPPTGCRFRTRCWKAQDICAQVEPPLVEHGRTGHVSACHFADDAGTAGSAGSVPRSGRVTLSP